jgi:hypothetical protein
MQIRMILLSCIRIRIRLKGWIRIHIKVKIQELSKLNEAIEGRERSQMEA